MGNCLPRIRWKAPVPIRRKRYSHKQTQTGSYPPGTIKKDDISKAKVGAQQISGRIAENFEESGLDDRKGCDEMSSSFVPEHVAKKDSTNSSELWYSTVRHHVKHEVSVIDSNDQTEYAFVSVPKRKANVASPEEHSEYDDVLVTEKALFA